MGIDLVFFLKTGMNQTFKLSPLLTLVASRLTARVPRFCSHVALAGSWLLALTEERERQAQFAFRRN